MLFWGDQFLAFDPPPPLPKGNDALKIKIVTMKISSDEAQIVGYIYALDKFLFLKAKSIFWTPLHFYGLKKIEKKLVWFK